MNNMRRISEIRSVQILLFCGLLYTVHSTNLPKGISENEPLILISPQQLTEDNFTSIFPIVCTEDGCIEGRATPGYQTEEYESFFGIPYAEPPVGKLRFANPVPKKAWTGLLNGKVERTNGCAQKNILLPNATFDGEEDCLYLNIYRPANTSAKRNSSLSVMVYIHEGGFFSGSINTLIRGPHYFMDTQQVILVLMTYRLGVLGFLSTANVACPGNFGLKDQTLALKWIKRNIKSFGGSPDSITIFGASAGAVAVHMHMMSPLSEDLFHRAIIMSGSATAPYNEPTINPLALAKRQAEVVGIENIDQLSSEELIEKLREVNVSVLVNSINELKFWSVDPITLYRPVIEPNVEGAFLIENPSETWAHGNFKKIPWMTGIVPNEGVVRAAAILTNKETLDDLNANLDKLLLKLMEITPKDSSKIPMMTKRLKEYYLNGSSIIKDSHSHGFLNMYTDRAFHYPFFKAIENYIKYSNATESPVYLYKFSYKGPLSYSKVFTGTDRDFGVGHIDDLIYLFKSPLIFREFSRVSEPAKMIQSLVRTLVAFAKDGIPTVWNRFADCTKSHRGAICDYQEFRNLNGDEKTYKHEVKTGNVFDLAMIQFWDEILFM